MNYTGDFKGKIFINGHTEGTDVSIFLSGETLILRDPEELIRRKNISISPFNKFMIFTQDKNLVKNGFFYEVKGTKVGAITEGPLGHPGDGEFNYWPIIYFKHTVKYFHNEISVEIEGKTETGTDGMDSSRTHKPCEFITNFVIPMNKLQELFQLTDFVKNNAFKVYEDVFK